MVDQKQPDRASVKVGVLGASIATVNGVIAPIGAPKVRELLAALALGQGRPVPAERLVDVLWRGSPLPGSANTLQGYVASLRRLLEPGRTARTAPHVVLLRPGGYELALPKEAVDAEVLEAAVAVAERALATFPDTVRPVATPRTASSLAATKGRLDDALALWRGEPYADLGDQPAAAAERRRLEEVRLAGQIASLTIQLALGKEAASLADIEVLAEEHPLRERLWCLWAVALVRNGRQAHALEVLRRLRQTLAEELGIDPGPDATHLQDDILRQDPSLLRRLGSLPDATNANVEGASLIEVTGNDAPPSPSNAFPLIGRNEDLARLHAALDDVTRGRTRHALVVGEAGIGKSRLVSSFAGDAVAAGAQVATTRCVNDDGAPPLWALLRTLNTLAAESGVPQLEVGPPPSPEGDVAAARFQQADAMANFLRRVAQVKPTVLVIEDAHWADPTTLRVLRHVVDTVDDARLMLLVSRRPQPAHRAVAELAAAMTRSSAVRLELGGLDPEALAHLVWAVARHPLTAGETEELAVRTAGNPLYVVELARSGAVTRGDLPASLTELVSQRLQVLPPATQHLISGAAVLGRAFEPAVLASATVSPELTVLKDLEPALRAGILRERTEGSWAFSHALVREGALATCRPRERELWHARVAEALESAPRRQGADVARVARHWRSAGAQHARRAWQATVTAAEGAREVFAFDEEVQLLGQALDAQRLDVHATDAAHYELLQLLSTACRLAADWEGAAVAVTQAIATAERMGEPRLAALAAAGSVEGAIWHAQTYGSVSSDLVHALRRSLALLDTGDRDLRCRVLLAIAVERFYSATPGELDELVFEALAIAEELGDKTLLTLALQHAFSARWRPETAEWRLTAARRAVHLARDIGDRQQEAACGAFLTIALAEMGQLSEAWSVLRVTLDLAHRHGHLTVLVILELLRCPLLLTSGRDLEAEQSLSAVASLAERVTIANLPTALATLRLHQAMWAGNSDELVNFSVQGPTDARAPSALMFAVALDRVGLHGQARSLYASLPATSPDATYMGMIVAALSAEAALIFDDPRLGGRMYDWLHPFAGRLASAGSTAVLGPVDAFLSLAAAAAGERRTASEHASIALDLSRDWGMARVVEWLSGLRERYDF